MRSISIFSAFALVILFGTCCSLFAEDAPAEKRIWPSLTIRGTDSRIEKPNYYLITDGDRWNEAWLTHHGYNPKDFAAWKKLPQFDFDFRIQTVIALFPGVSSNRLGIDVKIFEEEEAVRVQIEDSRIESFKPTEKLVPYAFFAIPRTKKDVIIEKDIQSFIDYPPLWQAEAHLTKTEYHKTPDSTQSTQIKKEPSTAPDKSKFGKLTGKFIYDGKPPVPQKFKFFENITLDKPIHEDENGRVSGIELGYREYLEAGIKPDITDQSLLVDKDGGVANVFVYAISPNIPWTQPAPGSVEPLKLEFKNGLFQQRCFCTHINRVEFVNHDNLLFDCRLHLPQNELNLGCGAKMNSVVKFTGEAGNTPTRYESSLRNWLVGYAILRPNPYYAISAADGTFSIPDLPPGKWEFRAWHEKMGNIKTWPKGKFAYEIKTGENNLGTIKLKPEWFADK
jgi:hypothetical protein